MKQFKYIPPYLSALLLTVLCFSANGQPDFSLSNGVYRIPYTDGTDVRITRDHLNHTPPGRIDMIGINGAAPYKIVAAGNGTIRHIDDTHENVDCDGGDCAPCNNYVWIEHPNGEWTKYTHFIKGSVNALGWEVDDVVCVGDYLGDEGDIGCASGDHLHFEVAVPDDINDPFDPVGGFINGVNLIPVICGIDGNVFTDDSEYIAGPCDPVDCQADLSLNDVAFPNVFVHMATNSISSGGASTVTTGAAGLFQAEGFIHLSPDFQVALGSEFNARIGECNKPVWEDVANCPNFTGPDPPGIAFPPGQGSGILALSSQPNPASDELAVHFRLPEAGAYRLDVLDVQGRLVRSVSHPEMNPAGKYTLELKVTDLEPGTYTLLLLAGKESGVERFVVAR